MDQQNSVLAYRKSEELLAQAKSIFGELVVGAAYVYDVDFLNDKAQAAEVAKSYVDYSAENMLRHPKDGVLDVDSGCVAFDFSNGRKVLFGSSEWSEIKLVNPNKPMVEV